MLTKLAIVGAGMTWKHAPFDDPDYEIWTTGNVAKLLPRVSAILDVHTGSRATAEELNRHHCLVWLQQPDPSVKYSESFPIDALVKKYGKIFNNSMTMLLGYAYQCGYDHIELYGVDLADPDGYEKYRANFLYLLGYGRGEGRNIIISDGSLLMRGDLTYCYESPSIIQQRVNEKKHDMIRRLEEKQQEREAVSQQAAYLRGALEMMGELQRFYGGE